MERAMSSGEDRMHSWIGSHDPSATVRNGGGPTVGMTADVGAELGYLRFLNGGSFIL